MGYEIVCENFFDTIEVVADAAVVESIALENGINFYYPSEDVVRIAFDEVTTIE